MLKMIFLFLAAAVADFVPRSQSPLVVSPEIESNLKFNEYQQAGRLKYNYTMSQATIINNLITKLLL